MKDALSVIYSRKSVRQYTGELVSKDQVVALLKAGMAAPTAVNKKPWSFVVVTDKEVLQRIADGLPHSRMILKAGTAIVVSGVLAKALPGEEQDFWVQDCSAAAENILLAAEAMDLGAVWTGVYPVQERVRCVQGVLGMPEDIIPMSIIAVGHPSSVESAKDKFELSNIHWQRW